MQNYFPKDWTEINQNLSEPHRISKNKTHEHHLVYVLLLHPSHQAVLPAHSVLLIPLHNVASHWALL